MTWDLEKGTSKGKTEFTKFPVGVTRIRIIDEVPHIRWVHWMQKFSRSINCPGKGCPICDIRRQQKANKEPQTYNMGRRYAVNILNRETERPELMEQGITFFEDLRDLLTDLNAEGKTFADVDVKVRRRGTGKDDTSYRIDLDEESPLSDEDKAAMDNKIDLDEYFKPHTPEQILRLLDGEEWNDVMNGTESDEEESIELE